MNLYKQLNMTPYQRKQREYLVSLLSQADKDYAKTTKACRIDSAIASASPELKKVIKTDPHWNAYINKENKKKAQLIRSILATFDRKGFGRFHPLGWN